MCTQRRKRKQARSTHLSFELFEDRCLLAAYGSFIRNGGFSVAGAGAVVSVPYWAGEVDYHSTDQLSHASASGELGDEFGSGFEHRDTTALVPVPTGGSIAVAQVSTAATFEANASDIADVGYHHTSTGIARGLFGYQPDPDFSQNMVFHGHLFAAVYGGEFESGNAIAGAGMNASASIGDATLTAYVSGNNTVIVTWEDIPGRDDGGDNAQSSNSRHIHFTVPIVGGAGFDFYSASGGEAGAHSYEEGSFAQLLFNGASAVWGYVTAEGDDLEDGDFNGDGNVDGGDFQLWLDDNPMADGDEDGDIDDDDLMLWVNNTDEVVVSSEADELDTDYSYGDFTLREALFIASDTNHPGKTSIFFAPTVDEIVLASGQLTISTGNDVDIVGLGADRLTIRGKVTSAARILTVSSGVNASISNVTLTGGRATGSLRGGAILNSGNFSLDSVVLSNCDSPVLSDSGRGVDLRR